MDPCLLEIPLGPIYTPSQVVNLHHPPLLARLKMSNSPEPWSTSCQWISDPKQFYRKVSTLVAEPVVKVTETRILLVVRVGEACLVRGPNLSTAYDSWVRGTVLSITSNFTFPDGTVTDKIVATFVDPKDSSRSPQVGTFFKRFYEICGLGQEHMMPAMTKPIFLDMIRTRLVWASILSGVWCYPGQHHSGLWAGIHSVLIPAFIEVVVQTNDGPELDVKFIHFRGGMTSPEATRVVRFRPFKAQVLAPPHLGGPAEEHVISHMRCPKSCSMPHIFGNITEQEKRKLTRARIFADTHDQEQILRMPILWCACAPELTNLPCRLVELNQAFP